MIHDAVRRLPRLTSLTPAALLCSALLSQSCGYMGPPLPPALNLPNRVTDLTAVQRGSKVVIHFTMSQMTTEAMPIKDPPDVDMRIGVSAPQFNQQQWLEHSERLPVRKNPTEFEVSTADFVGKDVVVAVRLLNDRGKAAGWSNFVALQVTAPVPRPEKLAAQATAQGVQLTWSGDVAPLYRVYRKGDIGDFAPLGDTPRSPYIDTTAEFLKTYTYFVQGVKKTGDTATESEVSDNVVITPQDIFPPAGPANVKAIIGSKSVELSWDRNTESDFAGYRIFRALNDGPFELLADKVPGASYSDRAIKPGRYRYAVSAFDLLGNESVRSPAIDALVP